MREKLYETDNLASLPTEEIIRALINHLVFVQPPPAGTEAPVGTKWVSDDEYNRVSELEQTGDSDSLLKELWRFQIRQGEWILTQGEVGRQLYITGYPTDVMIFGDRRFKYPSNDLNDKLGPLYNELFNRVKDLHRLP